jgi:hypothetical protein
MIVGMLRVSGNPLRGQIGRIAATAVEFTVSIVRCWDAVGVFLRCIRQGGSKCGARLWLMSRASLQ